jgi:acyl-CoA thioesterase
MMAQFDDDVATSEVAENHFRSQISGRYSIGTVPNGGYVMSVALAAIQRKFPERDPLTTTMHYLRPTAVGDVEVSVEIVKRGKRYDTAMARLVQNGKECARVLATFGSIANAPPNSPSAITGAPPSIVPVEDAIRMPIVDMFAIAKEFDQRFDPATAGFLQGKPSGVALLTGYIRFADGRNADPLSLPLFCDALPPPIFHVMQGAWFPTIELTVHVRAKPTAGWLRFKFETRFMFGGLLEEDGELWDEKNQLVAQSRQLMQIPSQ